MYDTTNCMSSNLVIRIYHQDLTRNCQVIERIDP